MTNFNRRAFLAASGGVALMLSAGLYSRPAFSAKPVKAAVIFSIANPGNAAGWDEGSYRGVRKLIDEHGWDVTIAEAVPFPRLADTAANYAESGFDVVIFTSSGHIGAWNEVSPKYPKTLFAMMSVVNALPKASNALAFSLDIYGYGVMGGMTAALASKSGTIAAVGGAPVPGLITWMSGIIEGAKAARPDIKVLTAFSGDWSNVPRAREVTAMQIERGADIIVMNAGGSTRGVLDAVETAGVQCVGYATDVYAESEKSVLTSVLMNIPSWYEALARAVAEGRTEARIENYGPDTFTLADMHGKLDGAVESKVRDTIGRYQRGELTVAVVAHDVK